DLDPEPGLPESFGHSSGIIMVLVDYGQYLHLHRSEPGRQCTGIFLDQQRKRPFIASYGRPVYDVRMFLLPVAVDVYHTELLGKLEVDLDGNKRILLAVNVPYLYIEFRSVECGLAFRFRVVDLQFVQYLAHAPLYLFPLFFGTDIFLLVVRIPLGETVCDVGFEADSPQHEQRKIKASREFVLQLLRRTCDVSL